jgi:hypothetical protein
MRVYVEGAGLCGPGLNGWDASRPVLAGKAAYQIGPVNIPASTLLPPTERRRIGMPVRLALAVGQEAFVASGLDASATPTVFTSSGGDCDNVHHMCEALALPEREVSPTRFHNSVHNAAAGYWSIATGCHASSTSLCAFDVSFAAGLLEAAVQVEVDKRAVALIAYDHPYPPPLAAVRHVSAAFGVALVLAHAQGKRALAVLDIDYVTPRAEPGRMNEAGLESLRSGVPAARCLPLLAALARPAKAMVSFDYGRNACVQVKVAPCN